jgi:peroxisomal membrane protein 4
VQDDTHVLLKIVLYVVSRVVATLIPRAFSPQPGSAAASRPIPPSAKHFSAFAALAWGAVMYLFAEKGYTIQPGMFNSMVYLYRDSDHWDGLKTLLLHNA